MLRIECFRDIESLVSFRSDWDRLSQGSIMRRPSWLLPWCNAYESTYRPCMMVAYRGSEVCGILPLAESKNAWTGNTLSFMGSGKVCTEDCGILYNSTEEIEVAEAFAEWLLESPDAPRWDHLNLDAIRETNLGMATFLASIQSRSGSQVVRKPSPNCWSASLEGGLVVYKSRLSKRARKILVEAKREQESGRSEFHVATTCKEAHLFLEEVSRLHQLRWKERGVEGCFADDSFRNFLHGALDSLWNDPWMPLAKASYDEGNENPTSKRVFVLLLKIEGRAAAGGVCIRDRDAIDVYLTGMNPEFAEVRPGWQLMQKCIELALELGCNRIDFLRGDEDYKARLGAESAKQERCIIASPRIASQLRSVAYRTASSVKNWWNKPVKAQTKTLVSESANANAIGSKRLSLLK